MIKYVLIVLWFNFGQIELPKGTGNAFVNYYDTIDSCMANLGKVPKPTNPDIEWWSAQCIQTHFNPTATNLNNWPWAQ